MRRLIVLGIVAMAVCVCAGPAYALSVNDTVDVSIAVNEVFSLTIGGGPVNLGTVAEGGGDSATVSLTCGTNRNQLWYLQVKADGPLTGDTPTNTIALVNDPAVGNTLEYWTTLTGPGDSASTGTVVAATLMTTLDQLAYTAALSEYSDTWVIVDMGIAAAIPYNTPQDTYSATLTVTMTE